MLSCATRHTGKLAKGKALHLPECRLISAVLSSTDRSTLHCPQRGWPTHLSLERKSEREGERERKRGDRDKRKGLRREKSARTGTVYKVMKTFNMLIGNCVHHAY